MAENSTIAASTIPPAYYKSLKIENVKCFKDMQTLDFSNGKGKPSQWTVIIGNNGAGKTTLLQCLAGLEPINTEKLFSGGNIQGTKGKVVPNIAAGGLNLGNLGANVKMQCDIYYDCILTKPKKPKLLKNFGVESSKISFADHYSKIANLKVYYYPANRSIKKATLTKDDSDINKALNPHGAIELLDAEDWLMQLDYAAKKKAENAGDFLKKVKAILVDILPEIKGFHFKTTSNDGFTNYVEVDTPYGKVPLKELSYGYLVMLTWIVDLVRRMVERYPKSIKPLTEPAIVLVDEIDLHMHPKWQRDIISFLTKHFPNTQFIVTSHSPLIVQSIDKVNVVLLQRDTNMTKIRNHIGDNYKGWTVEEILNDIMDLEKTKSDNYIDLLKQFEDALNNNSLSNAKKAYNKLDKILHPGNELKSLLKIQMTSIK